MKYGVFSDVHSNLEALETALKHFKEEKVDAYLCLGDIVGYGPNPNECIDLIKSLPHLSCVAGNHDRAAIDKKQLGWFNEFAQAALLWTKRELQEDNKAYLNSLPEMVENSHFTLVHGSPRDPIDEYLLGGMQVKENLDHFTFTPCFVGHSHLPIYFTLNSDKTVTLKAFNNGEKVKVTAQVLVINVGSVGQPRDGDPRVSCGVYDTSNKILRLARLDYPFDKTQEKMRKAKLPRYLGERLSFGR